MPWHCAIYGCTGRSNRKNGVAIHSFPNSRTMEEQWLYFVVMSGGPDKLGKESGVCSRHFTDDDYTNIQQYKMGYSKVKRLKRDAVPSMYENEDGEIQIVQKVENRQALESSAFQTCMRKYRNSCEKLSDSNKKGKLGKTKYELLTKVEKKKQEKHHKCVRRTVRQRKPSEVKNQDDAVSSSSVTLDFQPSISETHQTASEPLQTDISSKEEMGESILSPVGEILLNVQKLAHSKFLTLSKPVKLETQNCHLKGPETKDTAPSSHDETLFPSSTCSDKMIEKESVACSPDTSLCTVQQNDYAEFFGNMIAQRLRNLCPVKCAEAQVKMLQALINVENSNLNDLSLEPAEDMMVPLNSENTFPTEVFLTN